MNSEYPRRTLSYDSPITDSSRWDHYTPRDGDIVISTPPKCGTTWTQAICALLIFGRADPDLKPGVISPWFDAIHQPIETVTAMLEAQTHRRFIKTHTPLDGIPYYPQCRYLAVYRDPRDAHFSMRNHVLNQVNGKNTHRATKDIGAGFRHWATRDYVDADPDNFSLGAFVHHFLTFRRFDHLPNMLLMHFSDMSRDLRGEIQRCAAFLDIAVPDTTLDALAAAASFENMKRNASQFVPGAGTNRWKDDSRFFNKGTSEQWRESLSAEDLAVYDECIARLLPRRDIAWLQNGSR